MHETDIAVGQTRFDLPAPCSTLHKIDEFVLLREMHHRLANTLTVITSMLRDEFGEYDSSELRTSLARCEARIVAFGNLHRALIIGAAQEWILVQNYIQHLCEALSDALLRPLGIRFEVFADAVKLPSEQCELLGLVIAELVTNVAKHAFHGRSGGLVRVALFDRSDSWVCVVSDNGVGTAMASVGVGSRIFEQLVRALGGTVVRGSGLIGTSVIVACKKVVTTGSSPTPVGHKKPSRDVENAQTLRESTSEGSACAHPRSWSDER
jgi:two-component sensor histidine kinase